MQFTFYFRSILNSNQIVLTTLHTAIKISENKTSGVFILFFQNNTAISASQDQFNLFKLCMQNGSKEYFFLASAKCRIYLIYDISGKEIRNSFYRETNVIDYIECN